jgi:uncharacterized membrane protein
MLKKLGAVLITLILLLYPYLVYQGVQQGKVWIAPTLMISLYAYQAFKARHLQERLLKLTLMAGIITGLVFFPTLTAKLMPLIIQFILLHFFGRTLFKKQSPPLIERFVRLEFNEIPVGIAEYCRCLTKVWTGYFAFNIIVCLLLTFYAPVSWWAMYTGVGMFLGTGILMGGEYLARPFLFPDLGIPSLKSTIKNMIVNGRKVWEQP